LLAKISHSIDIGFPIHRAGKNDSWGANVCGRSNGEFLRIHAGRDHGYLASGVHLQHLLTIVLRDGNDVVEFLQSKTLVTRHFGGFDFEGELFDRMPLRCRHALPKRAFHVVLKQRCWNREPLRKI
jgi:hypothetical protein